MTNQLDRLALPGHPDLDSDIHDLTITAVVVSDDQELLVQLAGGHGLMDRVDGYTDVKVAVRAHYPTLPGDFFAAFVARLQRWRDTSAQIRMCASPDRPTTLIDQADGALVPIPRRDHPDWVR